MRRIKTYYKKVVKYILVQQYKCYNTGIKIDQWDCSINMVYWNNLSRNELNFYFVNV